jgi:hypothetical protein
MRTVMLRFKHEGPAPSLDDVRRFFNLEVHEIDLEYPLQPDPETEGIYTVRVDAAVSERVEAVLDARPRHPLEGIQADVRLEPFGPPEE